MQGPTDGPGQFFKRGCKDPRTGEPVQIFKRECRDQRTADLVRIYKGGWMDPWTVQDQRTVKVLNLALVSALECRVPFLGNSRLPDHFQSKDFGRISQKKVFVNCSLAVLSFALSLMLTLKVRNPVFRRKIMNTELIFAT